MPTLRRSMPSVALVREGELFLFDCGEGAQMRFRNARLRFSRLRWVLISHLHGDHVLGLMGLLMSLQMSEHHDEVRIVGPSGIRDFVTVNKRLLRTDFAYPIEIVELTEPGGVIHDGPEYVIEAARLQHRVPTYGYAVAEKDRPGVFNVTAARALGVPEGPLWGRLQRGETLTLEDGSVVRPEQVLGPPRPGLRVAYITDTRPCEHARVLARGADLLIHEATFGAELAEEAVRKRHSTSVEAAETALAAGAKRLVLTHFSPRYLDTEPLLAEAAERFGEVAVATDGLEITLRPELVPEPEA